MPKIRSDLELGSGTWRRRPRGRLSQKDRAVEGVCRQSTARRDFAEAFWRTQENAEGEKRKVLAENLSDFAPRAKLLEALRRLSSSAAQPLRRRRGKAAQRPRSSAKQERSLEKSGQNRSFAKRNPRAQPAKVASQTEARFASSELATRSAPKGARVNSRSRVKCGEQACGRALTERWRSKNARDGRADAARARAQRGRRAKARERKWRDVSCERKASKVYKVHARSERRSSGRTVQQCVLT